MTFSIRKVPLCWVSLCWGTRFFYCYAECRCAECRYAEYRGADRTVWVALFLCCMTKQPCFISTNHRYRKSQNRLLKVCCVHATSASLPRVSFFFSFLFLLQWPFTVLIKQTRQAVHAVKQSIFLDVYGTNTLAYFSGKGIKTKSLISFAAGSWNIGREMSRTNGPTFTRPNVIKQFLPYFYNFCTKLECLLLQNSSDIKGAGYQKVARPA